jgi:hypothetical protein
VLKGVELEVATGSVSPAGALAMITYRKKFARRPGRSPPDSGE